MTDVDLYDQARRALARGAFDEAVAALERGVGGALATDAEAWRLLGQARHMGRDAAGALAAFGEALSLAPGHLGAIIGQGHALRALGETEAAAARYREVTRARPATGEAWWSIAALKTVKFSDAEVRKLAALAHAPDAPVTAIYALGAAMAQCGRYDEAFAAWERGGALRLKQEPYSLENDRALAAALKVATTPALLEKRLRSPPQAPRPIFVVGLPRAGSTLLERILAAHPEVAAADEPPYLGQASARLSQQGFPPDLSRVTEKDLRVVADNYRGALLRHAHGRPNVVDKNPNNHWLAALIALALPDAVIIYARRDPLDQCVSAFGHLFARGFPFTSTLPDLGGYWRLVDDHLKHVSQIFADRIHVFDYERLIEAHEAETRRLLEGCNLPWNDACLAFHAAPAAVHTASAEQVRSPLYRHGIGRSKHYADHLRPLREALAGAGGAWPS